MALAFDNAAERKIYFYRVVPQEPKKHPNWSLDRKAVAKAIDDLQGTDDFYFEESDGRITCAEVHDDGAPQQLKFYAIRRSDLPSLDSGTGDIGDLDLAEDEGLAEAVHLRLFPNGIIGFEAFFYGPRISRIETFLNERCATALGAPVRVRQLFRGDVLARALKFEDIRVFHARIHPSKETRAAASGAGLKGVMDTASNFGADVWVDVRLRAEPKDHKFTERVKDVFRLWTDEDIDPSEFLMSADIEGKNPETNKVEPLNMLSDALVRVAEIPRESARSRALDSDAAFDAIKAAYKQVRPYLDDDGLAG